MPPPGGFPRPIGSVSLLFPIPQGLSAVVQSTTGFLQCFNGLVEAQFRMLVPDNKIGCVIGKGGDVSTNFPLDFHDIGWLASDLVLKSNSSPL